MRRNYTVVRGDTRTLEFDLAAYIGATALLQVHDLFEREIIIDGSSGDAEVTLEAADTEDAPDHRMAYRYNVQVTDGAVITTPQRGFFIVLPDVD